VKTNHQIGLLALIKRSRPLNLLTGPIIYSMVIPIALLDACVSFYQLSCFPIYGIPKISRSQFIIFDRQELKYLDWISKFHCTYCAYGVGVIGFAHAVIAATEAYFCPIKHRGKKQKDLQHQWRKLAFEQNENFDFNAQLREIRDEMTESKKQP
jgi:hypothetical protein